MPEMELIQQVGIHVEQVERGRVREPDNFHIAQQQEEIVQLIGLHTKLALVAAIGHAVQEVVNVFAPGHEWIVTRLRSWA